MLFFAAICGLFTVTIFSDFDPAIWHPRGGNISIRLGMDTVSIPKLGEMILKIVSDTKDQRKGTAD